uniref:Uncharacterized protein n=1 Tax=Anguilla anguilla TaxID=7936 RepID=A0A0E9XZ63_ANGAN
MNCICTTSSKLSGTDIPLEYINIKLESHF